MLFEWEAGLRLLVSAVLSGLIGYERQSRHKSAGLRTHILVGMGSCLIMILSFKIYSQVQGLTNADPARLAAQVVSGIGFLGAGSILKEGSTVKGLTTAASIWVVSGVGLAVGAGYYMGGLMTSLLVLATLTMLERMEYKIDKKQSAKIIVTTLDAPGQIGEISSVLGGYGVSIRDIRIDTQDGLAVIVFSVRFPNTVNTNEVMVNISELCGVRRVECK